MKRIVSVCMAICLFAAVLAGCGTTKETLHKANQTSKKTINDILKESQEKDTTPAKGISYPDLDYSADVDLTKLNSNMVYSTVYAMVTDPKNYEGKTVKANGTFDVFINPDTEILYYSCVIADATACCQQGIEFTWEGEHSYPEDYPKIAAPITIGGKFITYEEDGKTYCRIDNAQIAFDK